MLEDFRQLLVCPQGRVYWPALGYAVSSAEIMPCLHQCRVNSTGVCRGQCIGSLIGHASNIAPCIAAPYMALCKDCIAPCLI
jgi:hypothetical protein